MSLILLLMGHCFGDFFLQSEKMSRQKKTDGRALCKHCAIYGLCALAALLCFGGFFEILAFALLIALTHALIDRIRIRRDRKRAAEGKKESLALFVFDQCLHVAVLFILSGFLPARNGIGDFLRQTTYTYLHTVSLTQAGLVALAFLICLYPAGVVIKKVLGYIDFQKTETQAMPPASDGSPNTGLVIGMLERVCVLTLTLLGQYTAISFVIAAKSLARIKQLEDKVFAEKYLVGTLLSLIIALLLGIGVSSAL